MQNVDEDTITQIVLAHHAQATPRLKHTTTSVAQHLHVFARDIQLSEEERFRDIQFLTDIGDINDEKCQEFILLSDTLGLSMLVTALNIRKPKGCTESTVFGPFFVENAPLYRNSDDETNSSLHLRSVTSESSSIHQERLVDHMLNALGRRPVVADRRLAAA
jgi:hydroxyquinol 1,2-dioxygenase